MSSPFLLRRVEFRSGPMRKHDVATEFGHMLATLDEEQRARTMRQVEAHWVAAGMSRYSQYYRNQLASEFALLLADRLPTASHYVDDPDEVAQFRLLWTRVHPEGDSAEDIYELAPPEDPDTRWTDDEVEEWAGLYFGVGVPCSCAVCRADGDCCGRWSTYSVEVWPTGTAGYWYAKVHHSRNV